MTEFTDKQQEDFEKRYQIDFSNGKYIGYGGSAEVIQARDTINHNDVAIKRSYISNSKSQISLINEADIVSKLPPHKNIARYISSHRHTNDYGTFDYTIMQFYPYGNLKSFVKSQSNLCTEFKSKLAFEIIIGLNHIHKHNIIHRDLKPSNILISVYSASEDKHQITPLITDFGLGKISDNKIDIAGGTIQYSSPEQLQGKEHNFTSDIWSLGILLYELFLEELPFKSDSLQINLNPSIPNLNLVPKPFQKLVDKCLKNDPKERWQNIDQIINHLEPFINELSDTRFYSGSLSIPKLILEEEDELTLSYGEEVIEEIRATNGNDKSKKGSTNNIDYSKFNKGRARAKSFTKNDLKKSKLLKLSGILVAIVLSIFLIRPIINSSKKLKVNTDSVSTVDTSQVGSELQDILDSIFLNENSIEKRENEFLLNKETLNKLFAVNSKVIIDSELREDGISGVILSRLYDDIRLSISNIKYDGQGLIEELILVEQNK